MASPIGRTSMVGSTSYLLRLIAKGKLQLCVLVLIARFMGPTWGPSGAGRTQVGPMWAPWTLLSGVSLWGETTSDRFPSQRASNVESVSTWWHHHVTCYNQTQLFGAFLFFSHDLVFYIFIDQGYIIAPASLIQNSWTIHKWHIHVLGGKKNKNGSRT